VTAFETISGVAITSVDFHYESKSIFYVDAAGINKGISRYVLGESEARVILKNNFGGFTIKSVAVDWVNCKLHYCGYWLILENGFFYSNLHVLKFNFAQFIKMAFDLNGVYVEGLGKSIMA
jgi:hypothetical protein